MRRAMGLRRVGLGGWALIFMMSQGCSRGHQARVEHGRKVYLAHCSSCHDADPSKDGTRGPAVAGSSAELVEARVLRAEYPEGYRPKRNSSLMQPHPHLADHIASLAAYLGSIRPER